MEEKEETLPREGEEKEEELMEFSPCIHCGHENPTHLEGLVACYWCGHQ